MAITSITEKHSTRSFSINDTNERDYTRTFEVITDDVTTGAFAVAASLGFNIGDIYSTSTESDDLARLKNCSSECVEMLGDGGTVWKVVCEFGRLSYDDSTSQNPVFQPPEVEWSFSQFSRPTDQDAFGNPILNSSGVPFDEAVEIDDSRPLLRITRNELQFNAALAYYYKDAVNADGFFGAAAGQCKVMSISSRRIYDQSFGFYWQTSYEFAFDPNGFDKIILDQGYQELRNGELKPIMIDGNPTNVPVLLNGQGQQVQTNGQPYFKRFKVYNRLSFGVFNF